MTILFSSGGIRGAPPDSGSQGLAPRIAERTVIIPRPTIIRGSLDSDGNARVIETAPPSSSSRYSLFPIPYSLFLIPCSSAP
jgi:hypothetical protein